MLVSMLVNRVSGTPTDEDLLTAFANLGHVGPDELADLRALRAWMRSVGLPETDSAASMEDLGRLRAMRRAIRDLLLINNGVPVEVDLQPLESVPLRLRFDDGPDLVSALGTTNTDVVAGAVASALVRSAARPGWARLKACPGPGCAFAFRDTTRNGSRRWCAMSECGNRAKGAAFRARSPRGA